MKQAQDQRVHPSTIYRRRKRKEQRLLEEEQRQLEEEQRQLEGKEPPQAVPKMRHPSRLGAVIQITNVAWLLERYLKEREDYLVLEPEDANTDDIRRDIIDLRARLRSFRR